MIDFTRAWFMEMLPFAQDSHAGQFDRDGGSRLKHAERVAHRLARMFPDAAREQVQAALLHKVLEDTAVSSHDIRVLFGVRVAAIVQRLNGCQE